MSLSTEEKRSSKDKQSEEYKKHVKRISIIVIVAFLILAVAVSVPLIKTLGSEEGLEAFKEKLKSYSSITGVIVFTLIQAAQVVIAIVPPVQIVGGVLFGWFWGALLSFLGIVIGAFIVFVIVSKFGKPLVEAFVDEKLMTRYKFLSDEKKLIRILMILYIIPGVPKDALTYIVPLTKVSRKDFFLFVMPCRIPAVVMSTVLGSNVMSGNIKTAVVICASAVLIAIVGFVFKDPVINALEKHRHKPKQ